MATVKTICTYLDRFAPPELAAEWDNVGLLFGDPADEVQRIMTCLTVTPEVAQEAIESGVQLIVTHHPILFRGTKRLTTDNAEGKMLWPLARAGIAIYSPHTAFDNCMGGINDLIAQKIGLSKIRPLRLAVKRPHKIVVFVPEADLQKVSDAMFEAGAGHIGQYSQCSFRIAGTGTFFGSDAANPTVGQKGRREEVSEWRLEVVCSEKDVSKVIKAMRQAHSYEEPAYDVYPLMQECTPLAPREEKFSRGARGVHSIAGGHEGRVGAFEKSVKVKDLALQIKKVLSAGSVQVVGDRAREVTQLAIACGAAGEFLNDARRSGADAFLTGEMRFHDYLKANEMGIALILPGHYATERPAVEELAQKLRIEWPNLSIWASRRESDPVVWI